MRLILWFRETIYMYTHSIRYNSTVTFQLDIIYFHDLLLLLVLCMPSRQVQMSDVATPLVVRLLSASYMYILPPSCIQSSIICHGLPLNLFPNTFSSITVFNSESPLRVCRSTFCLDFIVRLRDLSSPIVSYILLHLSYDLCS